MSTLARFPHRRLVLAQPVDEEAPLRQGRRGEHTTPSGGTGGEAGGDRTPCGTAAGIGHVRASTARQEPGEPARSSPARREVASPWAASSRCGGALSGRRCEGTAFRPAAPYVTNALTCRRVGGQVSRLVIFECPPTARDRPISLPHAATTRPSPRRWPHGPSCPASQGRTWSSTCGSALTLKYHSGCLGEPPNKPTTA